MILPEMIVSIVGWIGVVSYVVAYVLLTFGWLPANTTRYHLLNAVGGTCLVVHASSHYDLPDLVVNIVWTLIAAFAIARIVASRKRQVKLEH